MVAAVAAKVKLNNQAQNCPLSSPAAKKPPPPRNGPPGSP
jgi:hypothetical protein